MLLISVLGCFDSRSTAARNVVKCLSRALVDRLPPVPAMNKWLQSSPMQSWMVFGSLCHHMMSQSWLEGILNEPGLIMEGGDGDVAIGAVAVEGEDSEEHYRRPRSRQAGRIQDWVSSEPKRMWASVALIVTAPLASLVSDYLQDEGLYSPDRLHERNGVNVWAPLDRGNDGQQRPTPRLGALVDNNFLVLRRTQCRIDGLLDTSSDGYKFLAHAFSQQPVEELAGALQHLVLETIGDFFLRFSVGYDAFPYKLLVVLSDTVPEEEKRDICQQFLDLPPCCKEE